MSNSLKLKCWL